jgi:hypothetical protein
MRWVRTSKDGGGAGFCALAAIVAAMARAKKCNRDKAGRRCVVGNIGGLAD